MVLYSFNAILREKAKAKIENLFWSDPYLYVQLCTYCETMRIDRKAKNVLIREGFLDENGDLPKIIRQAVYELTTGISIQDDLSGDRS